MPELLFKFSMVWLFITGAVIGQSVIRERTASEQKGENNTGESDQINSLVQKIDRVRSLNSSIDYNHPQYQRVQQQLSELKRQLERLRNVDGKPSPKQKRDSEFSRNETSEAPSRRPTSQGLTAGHVQSEIASLDSDPVTVASTASARAITKSLLTPRNLKPIGGWRFLTQGAGGKGLGFSRGGLYVEHDSDDERLLYVYGHQQKEECHLLKVSLSKMGRDLANRLDWPSAVPVKLLEDSHTIRRNGPYNLCRPHPGGPLLTTGRVYYATRSEEFVGPWMNWFDEDNGATAPLAVECAVNRRQTFGGGFCTIPKWFADEFLDGRDFGVGFGGYESGQGSSPGPSLFVADRPADYATKLDRCLELLSFRWGGGKDEREERPADYKKPLWGPPTEDGTGWWQADQVIAGPVWIDTPELTGLCYWSVQGLGDLEYKLQSTTFSRERRVRLYVYDPNLLAKVARGELRPHQVRGSFFEWELPFDEGPNASRWPIGAYWDAEDQLLYISYQKSGGGRYEVPPAVIVYRIDM